MIGVVGGLTTYDESSGDFFQLGRGGTAAVTGLFFGGLGAVVGHLVGNRFTVDRWVDVPHDRLRVSLGPQRDGRFGLGASVRF